MSDITRLGLTRYVGQSIQIGDDILFTINEVNGENHRCRVTIEAPREVPIRRKEPYQQFVTDNFVLKFPENTPSALSAAATSEMRKITVVTDENDGNEALYVDGDLVDTEHTFYASEISAWTDGKPFLLEHLTIKIDSHVREFPKNLQDALATPDTT